MKKNSNLQGMEHIKRQYQDISNQNSIESIAKDEGHYLKKELLKIAMISGLLAIILAVIIYYDRSTQGLEYIASKIISII